MPTKKIRVNGKIVEVKWGGEDHLKSQIKHRHQVQKDKTKYDRKKIKKERARDY